MAIEKAKALGAMALFGEKYGDEVRVVAVDNKSIELCGGTHIDNTAKIGCFRITSESSVAAGVRRIEAVTGKNSINLLNQYSNVIKAASELLKVGNIQDISTKIKTNLEEIKSLEKRISALESKLASGQLDDYIKNATQIGDIKLVVSKIDNIDSDNLKKLAEAFKAKFVDVIAVLAAINGDKVTFACCCGANATKCGGHAGNIVREIAKIAGGNGGGRPDIAMAGGKDVSKVDEALTAANNIVESILK